MHAYTGISLHESCVPHDQFSLPDFVLRYCNDVKTRYVQQSILPDSDWPPSLGGQYIRLALIKQQRSLHYHNTKAVIEHQIDYTRGDYDKIMERKTKIELINAFDRAFCDGGGEIVLRMLIDGAPGVGKTTLSRKVSHMWAKGEILQRYWLVLLLHLREKAISKAKTIDELIFHEDNDLQRDVIKYVKKRSGDGVLIIFDGFDELSSYERSEESLFLNISKGKILPKCAVAITSRPYASRSLQELPSINRHIEVLGFTDEQVRVCIMKKIKDEDKAEELCTELKDRLDIASICQIPLNCSIVLYVYEQENYVLPHTLTELYELFIIHSLKRFLTRTQDVNAAHKLSSIIKLQTPFDTHFSSLCRLSCKGLEDDKLVFSRDDLEKFFSSEYQESGVDIPVLDLMTSAKSYSSRGAQDTYGFLHLTIQEFLAAYWIAHYTSDDDKLHFFQKNLRDDRFRMVLLFLSGLTKLDFSLPSTMFSEGSWEKDKVYICHLMYEAGNHSLYKNISSSVHSMNQTSTSRRFDKITSRFDALVVSNFIAYSDYTWEEFTIRLEDIQLVHKVFSLDRLLSGSSIENVSVKCDTSTIEPPVDLTLLRYLDELPQIIMVSVVVDIYGDPSKKDQTRQTLFINSLREVFTGSEPICNKHYSLCLSDSHSRGQRCKIVPQFCEAVIECLAKNASIKKVMLGNVKSTDVEPFLNSLSSSNTSSHLECLTCTKRRGSNDKVNFHKFCTVLAPFISQNTSLKELHLDNVIPENKINVKDLKTIASALEHNTTLQKLILLPNKIYYERNDETGVMELTSSKRKWSLTSPTVQCQSRGKKRLQNVVHNVSDVPPAKRPHDDDASSNATEDALTSPQTIPRSNRPEMSTLSISCRSLQVSGHNPAHAYSLAGPSQVPYLTPSSGRDCATRHLVMSNQTQVVYSRAVSHELSVSQSNRPITTAQINHRQSPEPQNSPGLRHSLTGSSHSLCSLSFVDGDAAGCHASQMLDQTVQQSLPHQQHVPTPCDISTLGHHSNLIHDHDTSHDHTVAQHYQPGMSSLCQQPQESNIHSPTQFSASHASYQHPTDISNQVRHSGGSFDEPVGQPQSLATDPQLPVSSHSQPREQRHSITECSSIGASFGEPPHSATSASSLEHYSVFPHSMPYHEIAGVPQPIGGSSFVPQAPTSRNLPQERPPAYPHYAYPQMFPPAVPMGYPFPVPWPLPHYQIPPANQQQVNPHQMYPPSQPGGPNYYFPMPWPYPYLMQPPHHQQPTTSSQSASTTATTNSSSK